MKFVRFFSVLLLFTLFLGCGPKHHATLPEELVGVWKTSAPKYADRYFELQKNSIIFGRGTGTVISMHVIDRIEETREGHQALYTIFYTDGGTRYRWSFYYDPVRGKTIRLKNQAQIVWTKGS